MLVVICHCLLVYEGEIDGMNGYRPGGVQGNYFGWGEPV